MCTADWIYRWFFTRQWKISPTIMRSCLKTYMLWRLLTLTNHIWINEMCTKYSMRIIIIRIILLIYLHIYDLLRMTPLKLIYVNTFEDGVIFVWRLSTQPRNKYLCSLKRVSTRTKTTNNTIILRVSEASSNYPDIDVAW